jgi:hypothetical protein
MKFYFNKGKPNSYGLIPRSADTNAISVLGVSLNDLCKWEKIERLDYLKIDAEGAEGMILAGGAAVIAQFRPIIQVEVTLIHSDLPDGYLRFSSPGGINNLFIPSERAEAVDTPIAQGFLKVI